MNARSVLIVEDDINIRLNLKDLLALEGFEVELAENGRAALDLLNQSDELPCAILLDLMMPVMDGTQFREAQRKDPRLAAIPVALMSAGSDLNQTRTHLDAVAAFPKPLDVDAVLSLIEHFCD